MDRNKKNHPDGWLIFGFAFVAPALLPVILTLNLGLLDRVDRSRPRLRFPGIVADL
jgi:hypothetical protein